MLEPFQPYAPNKAVLTANWSTLAPHMCLSVEFCGCIHALIADSSEANTENVWSEKLKFENQPRRQNIVTLQTPKRSIIPGAWESMNGWGFCTAGCLR